jgi:hypothetical protein
MNKKAVTIVAAFLLSNGGVRDAKQRYRCNNCGLIFFGEMITRKLITGLFGLLNG